MPACKCGYCTFVPSSTIGVLPFPVRCMVDTTQARWGYVRGISDAGDVEMTLIMTDDNGLPTCIRYSRISDTTNVVLKLCLHNPAPVDEKEALKMWKARVKNGRSNHEVELSSLIKHMTRGNIVPEPLPPTTSICKVKDNAPCCKKRRTSTSFAPLLPYDAKSMGGDVARVEYLLGRFPTWNEEVVKELMRCDAYPLLHNIRLSETLATSALVTCVHPLTGEAVSGVWLPMDLLLSKYSALVRLAKRKN